MKKITIEKSELCWLTHNYTWDETDYNKWKEWLNEAVAKNDPEDTDYFTQYRRALLDITKDMDWDAAVQYYIDYQNDEDDSDKYSRVFSYVSYNGKENKETIVLYDALIEAMDEDAWNADYEIGDCLDTYSRYNVVDDEGRKKIDG